MTTFARRCLKPLLAGLMIAVTASCGGGEGGGSGASGSILPTPSTPAPTPPPPPPPIVGLAASAIADLPNGWAMTFLPDNRLLVTERNAVTNASGRLMVLTQTGTSAPVNGLPVNVGMLDIALHPQYATNRLLYFSFLEPAAPGEPRIGRAAGDSSLGAAGLAVGAAVLATDGAGGPRLDSLRIVWRQAPKIVSFPGSGEPGGRIAFSPDGRHLFINAGDRQEFDPVQELSNTLGKTIRLLADGSIPDDNPYVGRAGAMPEIWTLGHRNAYGLAFDPSGQLWAHEHGPRGGDEFNLIVAGANYGWPRASNGDHNDGGFIVDHAPGDGFNGPVISWTPAIAPAAMIFYSGERFAAWKGDAIISGLQYRGLIRVRVQGETASALQRLPLDARIREVEQAPDGSLWVLEDGPAGRLLRVLPVT